MRFSRQRATSPGSYRGARRVGTGIGALVLIGAVVSAPPAAAAAPLAAGDFSSSFETADAQPATTTVELDANGNPIQGNLSGTAPSGLPGSLLSQVTAVTASAENPPNEVAANLKDGNPSTKWLAFAPTGWIVYQLAAPAAVKVYSLTSANDSPGRDPKNWTLQGSNDGSTWSDVDTRTGQTFSGRFVTNKYTVSNSTAYGYYRLNITANSGDGLTQLADWDISDGSNTVPPPTPMVTAVGTGPISGYNMKPAAGFTGLHSLRYSGGARADGRSFATNKLYDVDIPVGDHSRLSYKIFPEFTGQDTQYPSTYAAVDLHFTDGTYLSALAPVDQHGYALTASGQGDSKVLYADQWNYVQSDIGAVANGKTIDRILLAYDDPGAKAATRFQGWIDDLSIAGAPTAIDGSSLTNYVDTRRGTNASGSFSRGNNLPITALPNGFNFFTPVTDAQSNSWEYYYQQANNAANLPMLQGLGISHEPSPWMGDRNQMSVMPVPQGGRLTGSPSNRALAFSHDTEIAQPDYYRVVLQGGLVAEMTPTDHAGVMRFTFPSGQTSGSLVFFNGTFTIGPGNTMTGWVDNGSGLSAGRSRMFVAATFDRAPTATTATSATFDTSTSSQVTLRIATSFLSLDQAQHNLDLEVAGKSFDDVRASARAAWNDRLGRISVQGASETQLVTLYSNLYRMNLYPNSQSENTGTAAAPHWQYASPVSDPVGQSSATHTGAKIVDGLIYVNNGFWDTYRTVWPAYSLLYPDVAARIADGFVQQYRDGGWIARWSSPGYADLMTGTSADVAMAEAYLNGVQLPDVVSAYNAAVRDATDASGRSEVGRKGIETSLFLGYTSTNTAESVSWGLDGFINDFGIGNLGAALSKDQSFSPAQRKQFREESTYFLQRAQNYVNIFDPTQKFFEGRDAAGNVMVQDPTVWGGPYTETDGWNFAFTVPQDGKGLANLYGGRQALQDKLDQFFATPENADKPGTYGGTIHEMREAQAVRMGQLGMSNQPSHHIPYMYDFAGAPAKTQKIVREILQRLYVGSEIGQGYPGDEDNGEMSSWDILSSLGLYPLEAGSPNWAIGSPLFTEATVHRSSGDIVVNAPANSTKNIYVQGLQVNGKKQSAVWLDSSALANGGTLDFAMGPNPSSWGTGVNDAPPSLTNGNSPAQPLTNTVGPGLGAASTGPDGQDASKLFDNSSTTQMTFANGTPVVTWKYAGNAQQRPTYYTLTSGAAAGDPADWALQGSNDGLTWATVDSRKNETFTWRDQTRPFAIDTPGQFAQFRLVVTRTVGAAQANLAEIELLQGGNVVLGGGQLTVTPAASASATAAVPFSDTLATVTGGSGTYQATVDWGDGTPATAGTLALASRGVYGISGSHTYAEPGFYLASVTVGDGVSQELTTVGVDVGFVSPNGLTAAFNKVCIGDDGSLAANCDGVGFGYSREALAAAGIVQGQSHGVPGTALHFTLPNVAPGQPDNATANGQTIALNLPADATAISFVGSGTEGDQDSTATVTFTDGSTATTPVQFSDWTLGGNPNATPSFGNIVVAKTAYRLSGTSPSGDQPFLFATTPYQIPAGKQIASVTLGQDGDLHVFASADDGTAPAPLSLTTPADQTATAGQTLAADLGTVSGGVAGSGGYHARVQWGDGGVPQDATISASGDITASHTYTQAGTFTVHVTAWDSQTSKAVTFKVTVAAAAAAPAITVVGASSVTPGDTMSLTGKGFSAGERVTVTVPDEQSTSTVTASSTGTISATLAMPASAEPGLHAVVASGASSVTPAAATVDVQPAPAPSYQPQVALSPTSGPHGTLLSIAGSGFAPRELITIEFRSGTDTLATQTIRSDGGGVLGGAAMTVPDIAPIGAADVVVTGSVSKTVTTEPFEVTTGASTATVYRPTLDLAASGSSVIVTGSGFAPNEQVSIGVDGQAARTVTADSTGSLAQVTIAAPADGDHAVGATGAESLMPANASFTVRNRTVSVPR
ncbi:MAG TPA: GH92 family glycosyl hydrolase [Jatrophihabitantaceae bacterium]|nr:GH92 family glycosyl hydrolase [Jatrophihabitantaceae bacterium]